MNYMIYGAGHFGDCFYHELNAQGESIIGWIDQRLAGGVKHNLPIFEDIAAQNDITIIVAVTPLIGSKRNTIKERLQILGHSNVLGFFEAIRVFPNVLKQYAQLEHLWMTKRAEDMLDDKHIPWLRNRLADDKSKLLLDKLCAFRQTLSLDNYPEPDMEVEYFPDDIPFKFASPIRLIDCGAYTGDTAEAFCQLHLNGKLNLEYVLSFEPDSHNYEALVSTQKKLKIECPSIDYQAFPAGVWEKNDQLYFNDGLTSSSHFDGGKLEKGTAVPVINLDSTCLSMNINYIKMDIEGAELKALAGSQELLESQFPALAICVYHKPKDLWKIPQLIDSLQPNYDMYLRVHEHLGLSTVLYCIPRVKDK